LAIADFLFAAWLEWITPFETALSSVLPASATAAAAFALSPVAIASRAARTAVRSSLFTALLRSVAFRLVLMRLICDLMFAMFHFLNLPRKFARLEKIVGFWWRHTPVTDFQLYQFEQIWATKTGCFQILWQNMTAAIAAIKHLRGNSCRHAPPPDSNQPRQILS
jgi:hypothetical protein